VIFTAPTRLFATMGLLLPLAGNAGAAVLRHALVVGMNDGGGSLEPLKYAESDARRVADLLVEIGDFDAEQVTVLYAPTREEMLEAIQAHAGLSEATDDDLFLLYYSGHADARGLRLGDETLRYEDLREAIKAVPAEVRVGVLDACRSGAIVRLKGARVTAPFLVEEDDLASQGEAWLTAATADEGAQESDQIRGSFFTHYLLSGLRGAADTGDGLVSLDEVYRYAYRRTVVRTGGTEAGVQHPVYDYRLQGQGDLFLTDVRRALSRVTIAPAIAGELTVLSLPDRSPVAEVEKPSGESVALALAPGRYLFRLRSDAGLQEVSIVLSEGQQASIERFGAPLTLEAGQLKGLASLNDITGTLSHIASEGQERIAELDLLHSPVVAGTASLLVPGAGQAYNGHWVKGGLLFAGTVALLGGGYYWNGSGSGPSSGSLLGSNLAMGAGAALYGYAVADAAWGVKHKEDFRPKRGLVALTETAWGLGDGTGWPIDTGIAADWIIEPGFSLGLDRTGMVTHTDGSHTFGFGSRMTLGLDSGRRLRPGAFVALDFRAGTLEDGRSGFEPLVGAGANLRWYLTPRYLVEAEMRQQMAKDSSELLVAGGLGVHIGGR
jgi:hypothetical protein